MFKKKDLPLIIGFSLPILMILFVAASIYLPGIFLHPKYNFLYSIDDDYYSSRYTISQQHLTARPPQYPYLSPTPYIPDPKLYIHDVTTNRSQEISFSQAQALVLDEHTQSPDGYTITDGSRDDGFFPFFWYSRDYNSKYLVGHNVSKKIPLTSATNSYGRSFHFLGWITQ